MNRSAFNGLLILVMVLCLAPLITFSQCGENCIVYVNSIPGRLLLILAVESCVLLCFAVYYINFAPASAIRSTRACVRLLKACILPSIGIPWGMLIAAQSEYLGNTKFTVKFDDAGYTSVASLAVCLISMYFFNQKYIELRQPQNLSWSQAE